MTRDMKCKDRDNCLGFEQGNCNQCGVTSRYSATASEQKPETTRYSEPATGSSTTTFDSSWIQKRFTNVM